MRRLCVLSVAGAPKAANVLVYTKETLIKTSYRELRQEIVLSPDYYMIFTAQCRQKQTEKQKATERGCCSVPREPEQIAGGGCGRQFRQKQHK